MTRSMGEIAADEIATDLASGAHDNETAGCRIDDEVAHLGGSGNQPRDEAGPASHADGERGRLSQPSDWGCHGPATSRQP